MSNWPEVKIKTWLEFVETIEFLHLERDFMHPWAFRGQSNSSWPIRPSITRLLDRHNINRDHGILFERTIFREFISKAHLFEDFKLRNFESGSAIVNLTIMQHYGCPTRLVDWTTSPFIALYFAVNSDFLSNGTVYVFNESLLNDGNRSDAINYDNILDVDFESEYIQAFMSNFLTKRLNSQQGIFTIAANVDKDHQELIYKSLARFDRPENSALLKLIIDKDVKYEFLARLRNLNVRPDMLYPDLFGLGSSLKDLLEIRGWEKNMKI